MLRHGLVRPSVIPPAPIRALHELTRYRKTLVQERAAEVNRLQTVRESANLTLSVVASAILGASGCDMLNAIVGGAQDAAVLADLARGRLRAKLPALRRALDGRVKPYHRTLSTRILAHIDFLEESLAQVQTDIAPHLAPFEEARALVRTIPGCTGIAAATLVAEIGVDMNRFPSATHLASWAGLCPGNKQSGGKRLSGRLTKGNP